MSVKGQVAKRRYPLQLPETWEVAQAFNRGWDTQSIADYWGCSEAYVYNRLAEMD